MGMECRVSLVNFEGMVKYEGTTWGVLRVFSYRSENEPGFKHMYEKGERFDWTTREVRNEPIEKK